MDVSQLTYRGNSGYNDDPTRMYQYDSLVPNSSKILPGDTAIIRSRGSIIGVGIIEKIDSKISTKDLHRCPFCTKTQIKFRKTKKPDYRCGCGKEFDQPQTTQERVEVFIAYYGNTYLQFNSEVSIREIWDIAPKINKQHSILKIDTLLAGKLIDRNTNDSRLIHSPSLDSTRYYEGGRKTVWVEKIERNSQARKKCIDEHGSSCSVCEISLADYYGRIAEDLIHVHHLNPLAESESREIDPVNDLVPVCPNCHSVIHSRNPIYTIEELRKILEKGN